LPLVEISCNEKKIPFYVLQIKLKVQIKVSTYGHDNPHIIDEGMGRGDHGIYLRKLGQSVAPAVL
jgi:hypothetical protein